MNILLTAINAKYIHSNLAVYSLRAYVPEYREEIQIAEYTINQQVDNILMDLYRKKPDILCFSCYLESGLCRAACEGGRKDSSRSANLDRRPRSIL